jgi:hypothetical protein
LIARARLFFTYFTLVGDSGLLSLTDVLLFKIALDFDETCFFVSSIWSFVLEMRFSFALIEVFGARTVICMFSPSTVAY